MSDKSKVEREESLFKGKWLELQKVVFRNKKGDLKEWDCVSRLNCAGAAAVIAMTEDLSKIVLLRQFRPPAGKYIIEFPAGLIEPGETAESTVVRELKEETGLNGELKRMTPPSYSSPGLSGEAVNIAVMRVVPAKNGQPVKTAQEDNEDITVLLIPAEEICCFLSERQAAGDGIDAKVAAFALGASTFSAKIKKSPGF
jgi:8-oxo-dGTP pyrophosphatase MutT (NUDIX family)